MSFINANESLTGLGEPLRWRKTDRCGGDNLRHLFAGLICILAAVGVQMVHSASLTSAPGEAESAYLNSHLTSLLVASLAGCLASRLTPDFLQRHASLMLKVFVLLLILVLLPGTGVRINGAQRWLRPGGMSIQPSELGRLVLPIAAAAMLCGRTALNVRSLRSVPGFMLPLAVILPLVAVEPDLGATVFLAFAYLLTLFIGGWPVKCFLAVIIPAIPVLASVLILKPYQLQRISGFIAAWQDLSQAPWQVRQSLLSLGSGGLSGTGIGGGWQKLSYLPEANTDFVFAVIGEELGLIGTAAICLLWVAVLLNGRALLKHLPQTSFGWILGHALLLQLVFQALANVAVVTAMVPPKGVPHPLISFGGTNLLVSLISVGLIVGMARHQPGIGQFKQSSADKMVI